MKTKVTVHFGSVKVVVPCHSEMSVADLTSAAVLRYKKATGKSIGCQIRVHHVECLRDGGILDPDDRLFDVFDEGIDQILAIYDENEAKNDAKNVVQNRGQTAACSSRLGEYNVRNGKKSDSTDQIDAESCSSTRDFVEITNLSEPPHDGLLVSTNEEYVRQQEPSSSSSINAFARKEDFPCSVDQKAGVLLSSTDDKLPKRHKARPRVTISPDVDYRKSSLGDDQIEMTEQATSSSSRLARSNARKSRITDAFFEAQERLEANKSTTTVSPCVRPSLTDASKLIPPVPGVTPGQTVIVLSDATMHRSVGIEIVAVQDPTNSLRLRSVEITNIDSEGRVGVDGRIKVGDCITEINQRPVYQMSVSRARAYLHELQSCAHPSLTIDRPFETFIAEASAVGISHQSEASSSSLQTKPIFSALQQANTTAIGATSSVEITKNPSGFGFTLTSRDTAKGERLFYIGTVKPGGAAIGLLRAGDRILEINGVSTTGLQQQDLVTRLKALQVGEKVRILLSRIASDSADPENTGHLKGFKDRSGGLDKTRAGLDQAPRERASEDIEKNEKDREKKEHTKRTEVHCFDIALNDSGSAGLGISLKARAVMRPDGTRQDCGIFIKKVLHGGAAYKDGRLRINDRLIGIEDVDLISLKHNSEASEAITKCLKGFGASATSVRLRISRKPSEEAVANLPSSRESFDDTVVSGNLDMKASSGNVQTSKGHFTSPSSSKAGVREAVERRSSVTSGKDDSTLQAFASEEEESNLDDDVFSRENPTRRSMSEKRHMGAADPSHTLVYQKIKHCRQTSAPTLRDNSAPPSTTRRSSNVKLSHFTKTNAPRNVFSKVEKRIRHNPPRPHSLSILERTSETLRDYCNAQYERGREGEGITDIRNGETADYESDTDDSTDLSLGSSSSEYFVNVPKLERDHQSYGILPSPKRRSMSMESIGAYKAAARNANGSVPTKKSETKEMSRSISASITKLHIDNEKTEERLVDRDAQTDMSSNLYNGGGASESYICGTLPARKSSTATKEKQHRRKSAGSSFFSKLSQKFGASRSRETSPEKAFLNLLPSSSDADRKRQESEVVGSHNGFGDFRVGKHQRQNQPSDGIILNTFCRQMPAYAPVYGCHSDAQQSFIGYTSAKECEDDGNEDEDEHEHDDDDDDDEDDNDDHTKSINQSDVGFMRVANSKFYGSSTVRDANSTFPVTRFSHSTISTDSPPEERKSVVEHHAEGHQLLSTVNNQDLCDRTVLRSTSTINHPTASVRICHNSRQPDEETNIKRDIHRPNTTISSTHGSRRAVGTVQLPVTVVQPCGASLIYIHEDMSDPRFCHPKIPPHRAKFTTKDSDHVPVVCRPVQQKIDSPATVYPPVSRTIPVVYPTSRIFFNPASGFSLSQTSHSSSSTISKPSNARGSLRKRQKPHQKPGKTTALSNCNQNPTSYGCRVFEKGRWDSKTPTSVGNTTFYHFSTDSSDHEYLPPSADRSPPPYLAYPSEIPCRSPSKDFASVQPFSSYVHTDLPDLQKSFPKCASHQDSQIRQVSKVTVHSPTVTPNGEVPSQYCVPFTQSALKQLLPTASRGIDTTGFDYKNLLRPVRRNRLQEMDSNRRRITMVSTLPDNPSSSSRPMSEVSNTRRTHHSIICGSFDHETDYF